MRLLRCFNADTCNADPLLCIIVSSCSQNVMQHVTFHMQGSGKSTLVEQLVHLLRLTGRAAVDVSIDDFYLSFQARPVTG